ncbi:hypothetical protein J5690_06465 [bacterium]|nr:hypothetical protein [bacterium]
MNKIVVLIGFFMILSLAGCCGGSSSGEKGDGQRNADSAPFNDDETADFEVVNDDDVTEPAEYAAPQTYEEWQNAYANADAQAEKVLAPFVEANTNFGMNLFAKLNEYGENIMISPLSISIAMAMTLGGAGNSGTYDELMDFLGYKAVGFDDYMTLNGQFDFLLQSLTYFDKDFELSLANSMWLDDAFSKKVNKTFVNDLKKYYDAGYFVKDFADSKTVGLINSWINNKTKGKIAEIIDEIDENTVMLLLNAVYFRANWMQEVDSEEDLESGYFTMSNGAKKQVQFFSGMFRERRFYNGEIGKDGMNIRMLAVPFGRRAASIYFFMPRYSDDSVDAMISEMAENGIGKYFDRVNNSYGDYSVFKLPRVKFKYDESIEDDFSRMGLKKPFDENYGFDGIVNETLIVSKILHNTYFSMDEKGVEASAVTEVYMECLGEDFEPTRFRFDRPFVFAVRDDRTGTLLFIGKVEKPEFD